MPQRGAARVSPATSVFGSRMKRQGRLVDLGRKRLQRQLLILFAESLKIGFAVWIERFLAALLPGRFKFGRRDIPVRPTFFANSTQILAEFFHRGSSEEP